jgi:hypothetical protein
MFDYVDFQCIAQIIGVVIVITIAIKCRFRIQFRTGKDGFLFDASPVDSAKKD